MSGLDGYRMPACDGYQVSGSEGKYFALAPVAMVCMRDNVSSHGKTTDAFL